MSIKIKGLDKLMSRLSRLEKKGARAAMRKATTAGTAVIRRAVREGAPVDEGMLKRAEDSKVSGKGLSISGRVGANVAKLAAAHDADADRPTNIDWLVEFGHVTPDGRFVAPSGFMRRAADASLPQAHSVFASRLAVEIEREALRG